MDTLEVGQRVKIDSGSYAGSTGVVKKLAKKTAYVLTDGQRWGSWLRYHRLKPVPQDPTR